MPISRAAALIGGGWEKQGCKAIEVRVSGVINCKKLVFVAFGVKQVIIGGV